MLVWSFDFYSRCDHGKKTFAMQVKEITRVFKVVNGELSYVVQMATVITSLQPHLKALLKKV